LAIRIKQCNDVKGILIDGEKYKITQFADDTSLLLDGTEKSLNNALKLLNIFSEISGLKVNLYKSKVIRIGSLAPVTLELTTNEDQFTITSDLWSRTIFKTSYDGHL
jgi:hypothetical protein